MVATEEKAGLVIERGGDGTIERRRHQTRRSAVVAAVASGKKQARRRNNRCRQRAHCVRTPESWSQRPSYVQLVERRIFRRFTYNLLGDLGSARDCGPLRCICYDTWEYDKPRKNKR